MIKKEKGVSGSVPVSRRVKVIQQRSYTWSIARQFTVCIQAFVCGLESERYVPNLRKDKQDIVFVIVPG